MDMNPASTTRSGGADAKSGTKEIDTRNKKTPSPELQMEDAGTPASGNSGLGGRGSATEGAMKQTDKTSRERGIQR
jgi:hypothetical protein